MIRRPNVRARCFQLNLQARWPGNRKYDHRSHKLYVKTCRWCKRPREWLPDSEYPRLCYGCADWLKRSEWNATIVDDGEGGNTRFTHYLAGYRE